MLKRQYLARKLNVCMTAAPFPIAFIKNNEAGIQLGDLQSV